MKPNKLFAVLLAAIFIGPSVALAINSGSYYELISTCDATKALTITYDSLADGASAVLGPQSDTRVGQIFKIEAVGPYYKLTNKNSGKVLDISGGSMSNGAPLIQWTYSGANNQLFTILNPTTGIYQFQNVKSLLNIDLTAANVTVGTKFQQYASNTSCAQKFKLKDMSALAATSLFTDHVFASTSPWYTAIPTTVTLNSNSANMLQDFLNQKPTSLYNGTVNVNTRSYSSPVFIAPAGAATVKVSQWDCQKKGYFDPSLATQWAAVPVPANAQPSSGTDGEMTIYQPSTNTIWEFWKTQKYADGTWHACWGGRMQNASTNPGYFPANYGTTATSLPFLAGQITANELKRGEIKHAIGIALRNATTWSLFSWPAQRSDGNGASIIPEGTRIRLDPTINVDSLSLHPMAKIIAKAAQKYGFIVWDRAGSISIRAQNLVSYTALGQPDPYHSDTMHTGLFGTTPDYDVLKNFPWSRLQFLPMNYGKP